MTSGRPAQPQRLAIAIGICALVAILFGVAIALAAASLGWTFGFTVERFEATIESWGAWGVLASVGLMILHSFVPFPAEFLAIANGMIYGPLWGTLVTWTGAMLGAFVAFGLSRWLGRPFVEVVVARRNWHAIDAWAAHEGAYVVLVGRLVPVIAFNLINYAAGLSRLSWWAFAWTTGLGILPLTVLMVVMGHNIHSLGWESWAALFAGVAILWLALRRRLSLPDRGRDRVQG